MDPDWLAVENEIDRIVAEEDSSFSAPTIAHVRDCLELVRRRCPVRQVFSGYWRNSIRFCRTGTSFEIEVFEDRLEQYRFHDRRTEIRHIAHVAGDPFPAEFLSELPSLPAAD